MVSIELVIVQFAREQGEVSHNILKSIKMLGDLKFEKETIIVYPELWISHKSIPWEKIEEVFSPLIFYTIENNVWLVPGAFYVKYKDKTRKSLSIIISPKGEIHVLSEKHFPSHPMQERKYLMPGKFLRVYNTGKVKIGSVICVDAMYPEISRYLAINGAEIIVNPSSIPENRISLWRSLARIRASENTVFWASILLTGTVYPDGRNVRGGSIVVDPSGNILYESGPKQEVIRLELDLEKVKEQRQRWPYLKDIQDSGIDKIYSEYWKTR